MTDMADIDRQNFEVVRRGYDIDQVDAFLVHQAEAWRAELFEARKKISELEGDRIRLEQLETEVEQSRKQQEALTLTLQTAAQARDEMLAKADQDVTERRASTELELKTLRAETQAEVDRKIAETKATTAAMLASADQEVNDARHRARMRTDELMLAQEEQLQQRQAELDEAFGESKLRYELAEKSMKEKITELNAMRAALVTGLEAIASGGLSALENVSDELAAVGITNSDDSAVHDLVGGSAGLDSETPIEELSEQSEQSEPVVPSEPSEPMEPDDGSGQQTSPFTGE